MERHSLSFERSDGAGGSGDSECHPRVPISWFLCNTGELIRVAVEPTVESGEELTDQENSLNFCCFQGLVLQVREPSCQAYTDLISAIPGKRSWIAIREKSNDGVDHCHCLVQTLSRSDSVRRSLTRTESCQVVKCAKAHKPTALLQYMLKSPEIIFSNDVTLLTLARNYLHLGKVKTVSKTPVSTRAPDIVSTICSLMRKHAVFTFEELMKCSPTIMSAYLAKPQLVQIVQNCAAFVKASWTGWSITNYTEVEPSPQIIHQILTYQGINVDAFDSCFYQWVTKTAIKRNTLCLIGPSNAGKSGFISGLKELVSFGEIQNGGNFMWEGLKGHEFGVWEEPLLSQEAAEKGKQILEGMLCTIPVKWQKPYSLPRTPILITTNHVLWRYCSSEEPALRNRMFQFAMTKAVVSSSTTVGCRHSCMCGWCDFYSSGPNDSDFDDIGSRSGQIASTSTGATTSSVIVSNRQPTSSGLYANVPAVDRCVDLSCREHDLFGTSCSASEDIERADSSGFAKCNQSSVVDHSRSSTSNRSQSASHGVFGDRSSVLSGNTISGGCLDGHSSRSVEPGPSRIGFSRPSRVIVRRRRISSQNPYARATDVSATVPDFSQIKTKHPVDQQALACVACSCLRIPTAEDWMRYLSYLYQVFKNE